MIPNKCRTRTSTSRIKVEEGNRKAVFLNDGRDDYLTTQVDGCVVRNATACDWVVTKVGVGDVLVELKGTDVDHAVKQVTATAALWAEKGYREGKMAVLIVARQYPSFDTKVRRAAKYFHEKYSARFHVRTKNLEYNFEDLLST